MSIDLEHGTSPLSITITSDLSTLCLHGELDDSTTADLVGTAEFVLSLRVGTLTVDLDDVGFIGAAGLNALVRIERMLTERGGALHVRTSSPRVRRVFHLGEADWLLAS